MKFYLMISYGVPNIPDYVAVANIEEVMMAFYNSNMKTPEPRQDWVRKLIEDDPHHWETTAQGCIETDSFKQRSNQTGGMLMTFFSLWFAG